MTQTRIGNYIIERELGRGGMGVVSLARHAVLGTRAVVKQLVPELTGDAVAVQRFIVEAQAAAALRHPNIVEVTDCGQAADSSWYIVLEFLEGAPLSTRVRQGPCDIHSALELLAQAGGALHAAHMHGIVHRDVKPDNIFLTASSVGVPHVTLLDFGIAKLRGDRPALTRTGIGMGTPAYMPPEQLLDAKDVDARADVYALGVVAFEMLTGGHLPWGETTAPAAIYARQTKEAPPDARHFFASVPSPWALVIQRAMAPNVDDRWPTMRDLILALAEATPPDAACPGGGADIVRRYAPELLASGPTDDTVGSRLSNLEPISASAPSYLGVGRPTPPLHAAHVGPPVQRGATSWVAPSTSPRATTLGSATGQPSAVDMSGGPGAHTSRRSLVIAAGAVAVAGITIALAVALGGASTATSSKNTTPPDRGAAATPTPASATSALAIVTEPTGAKILVDGVERGASPLNVVVRVGQVIRLEGALDGYELATTTATGAEGPSTVRIIMTAQPSHALPDAGLDGAATVDARKPRPRPSHPAKPSTLAPAAFDPDAVGGGR